MGTLKNCSECGKLYTEVGQGMCRDCYEKEQEQEQVVYDYVRDHDKCGIKEIVDDTLIEMTGKDISFRKPADAEIPPQPKPKRK